jgi:hypothetical protein
MWLKVLSFPWFLISHILLIGGLVLVTLGLLKGNMVLNIIGIWAFALGLCVAIGFSFKKLVQK